MLKLAYIALFLVATNWCRAAPESSPNSIGMRFIRVSAGEFFMGMANQRKMQAKHKNSAYQREIHDYIETPSFRVRLTRDFEMAATEVTKGQFQKFVDATGYQTDAEQKGKAFVLQPEGKPGLERFVTEQGKSWRDPGFEQTDDHPVTCISWNDAVAFCDWLGKKESADYHLPTEAEWEFACRAGTTTPYASGDDPEEVYSIANVADAALSAKFPDDVERQRIPDLKSEANDDGHVFTAPVGTFKANAWGLHDMHGNLWEWCSDKYSDRIYKDMEALGRERGSRSHPEPIENPAGPETTPQHQHGDWRSLRGGSWFVAPLQCRSSVRAFAEASDAYCYIGFRVVREVQDTR